MGPGRWEEISAWAAPREGRQASQKIFLRYFTQMQGTGRTNINLHIASTAKEGLIFKESERSFTPENQKKIPGIPPTTNTTTTTTTMETANFQPNSCER